MAQKKNFRNNNFKNLYKIDFSWKLNILESFSKIINIFTFSISFICYKAINRFL